MCFPVQWANLPRFLFLLLAFLLLAVFLNRPFAAFVVFLDRLGRVLHLCAVAHSDCV